MQRRAGLAMFAVGLGLGAAFASLLRRRTTSRRDDAVPAPPPPDLTDIKGIGPVYRDRLAAAGIDDIDALIAAGPASVAAAADVVEAAAADWIAQAAALSGGG